MLRAITNSTDIRIFILYLLMQLDRKIDYPTLNDMAVQDDFINQFDLIENLDALEKFKNITRETNDGTEYYEITPRGRAIAGTLESEISAQIKEKSLRSALRLLSFEKNGSKAESEVKERADGRYDFSYKITDTKGHVISGMITLDTKRTAEGMKLNFDEKPEFIYKGILSLMSGDVNYLAECWMSPDDK